MQINQLCCIHPAFNFVPFFLLISLVYYFWVILLARYCHISPGHPHLSNSNLLQNLLETRYTLIPSS